MITVRRPRHRRRAHRSTAGATIAVVAIVTAACGGGSDAAVGPSSDVSADDATANTDATATTVITTSEPTLGTVSPGSQPSTTVDAGSADEEVRGNASFDGPDFTELANSRMDELAVTFDLPVAPDSLAPVFELPGDFPYPTGAVVGVFHEFELDQRYDDDVRIDEERIVGIDGQGDPSRLDAILLTVEQDTSSRWQRASSQRDAFNNDLYTALPLDGGDVKDRLVIRGVEEPDPGEPFLQLTLEQQPTEIPVPTWKAGLPTVDGGVLTNVREGRGVVDAFGRVPDDGFIELREYYPVDRFEDLEVFFASGIIESAGFVYEDTPFNNFSIRVDVSNEEWSGTVGVGEITIDGALFGYQLIWTLTRSS